MTISIFNKNTKIFSILIIAISAAVTVGVGIGTTFGVKNYVLGLCQEESDGLNNLIGGLLNRNISVPKILFEITTGFPSQFLLNTTVETNYGPAYVDTNITLDFPKTVTVPIGPYIISVQQFLDSTLGADSVTFVLSFTQIIDDVCSTYLSSAIYAMGAIFTIIFTWLTVLTTIAWIKMRLYDEIHTDALGLEMR